jgi:hypothetical protein
MKCHGIVNNVIEHRRRSIGSVRIVFIESKQIFSDPFPHDAFMQI